jgi:hypothetical protein
LKTLKVSGGIKTASTWEESSGLIGFLSGVSAEVDKFNRELGFGFRYVVSPPSEIDGNKEIASRVGFVVIRRNPLFPERTYCLYSVLSDRVLHGYIGLYNDGLIVSRRELRPLKDFGKGAMVLHDWFRSLLKASCEK